MLEQSSTSDFFFMILFLVLFIFLVMKYLRWFWKVNQQVDLMKQLNEESAKTTALVEKVC